MLNSPEVGAELYRVLLNLGPDGVMVLRDGVIQLANRALADLLGASEPEALVGRELCDFIAVEDRAAIRRRQRELQQHPGIADPLAEQRLLRVDGSPLLAEMRGASFLVNGTIIVQGVVRDISRYKEIERQLTLSERRFHDVAEAGGAYVYEIDRERRYTYLSGRTEDIVGYRPEELLGKTPFHLMNSEDAAQVLAWAERHDFDCGFENLEYRMRHKSGREVWMQASGVPFFDEKGERAGMRGTGLDITRRKEAEFAIQRLATHDALTNLPNRSLLLDRLQQALYRARRQGTSVAVMAINLDAFKRVNDHYGLACGDELLRQVAARLLAMLRADDTLARLGNDEFVAVLEGVERREDARRIAANIVGVLARPFLVSAFECRLHASVGVSFAIEDGNSPDELMRRADLAMYACKNAGGNNCAVYTKALEQPIAEFFHFEHELQRAIVQRELMLHYQPIVAVSDGSVLGVEALVRWHHPKRGLLSPSEFVPHAEATNLIVPLGDWVAQEACRQLGQWRRNHGFLGRMSINVSIKQLVTGMDFVQHLRDTMTRYEIPADYLELEVTESVLAQNVELVLESLQAIRRLGISVAMDDFGTGYSSLYALRTLPIDKLKIDRSFLTNLREHSKDIEVLRAIVLLGKTLGLEIVAEGVETEEQLGILAQMDCHGYQGYLIGAPATEHDFVSHHLN